LLLPACSQQDPGVRSPSLEDESTRIDRKAAATLSLANSSHEEFDSEHARAVACASALRTMVGIVRDYGGGVQAAEMRALERAEEIYRTSAFTSGRAENVSEQGVRSRIDKATEAGRQDAAAQVQLSLACMEKLG
jgi:hypothetical protein